MTKSIIQYAKELTAQERRKRKYSVVPADLPAKLPRLPQVRAVLWDVYGTLLGHPMGDLANHSLMERNTRRAFRETARMYGLDDFLNGDAAVELRKLYDSEIQRVHRRKERRGISSPEVRIERVWLAILRQLQARGYHPRERIDLNLAFKVAYFFDHTQQFKVLYPGARQTLNAIRKRGLRQGIISNAQFYTPLTLNMLLREAENSGADPMRRLFDPKLVFFSYKLGVAKPNLLAFEKARHYLEQMRIEPAQVVLVGNDIYFDATLAHRTGFQAVLFAGDRRSITLRTDDPDLGRFEPDGVIKELIQLLDILGIAHEP